MFGLLNVAFRPLGGYVADLGYRYVPGPPGAGGSVWAKKALLHGYALMTGLFLILIGKVNTKSPSTLYGLVAGVSSCRLIHPLDFFFFFLSESFEGLRSLGEGEWRACGAVRGGDALLPWSALPKKPP